MAKAALAQVDLCALRQEIARIEAGNASPASFSDVQEVRRTAQVARFGLGIEAFDDPLEGGLPLAGMSELRAAMTVDAGPAAGFALALALLASQAGRRGRDVLWITESAGGREAGSPHAAGLVSLGFAPENLVHALPRRLEEALWVAETALGVDAFAAIILEVRGNPQKFGLTESRRLHLRAVNAGVPLFLLRQAGEEEASAALVRCRVEPAPARGRLLPDGSVLAGTIGNPAFRITVEKSRNPGPFELCLEWNPNELQFYTVRTGLASHEPGAAPAPAYASTDSGDRLSASAGRPGGPQAMGRLVAFRRAS